MRKDPFTLLLFAAAVRLSAQIEVTSGGNVGIGTTSPTEKLEIDGTVRINATNQTGILAFGNRDQGAGYYDTGVYRGGIGLTTTGNYLNVSGYSGIAFNSSAAALGSQTTRMYIDGASGNVGIGTSSPGGKLDVSGIPNGTSVFFRSIGRPFLDIKGGVNSYKTLRFSNVGSDTDFRWDLNVLPGDDGTNPNGLGWWSPTGGQVFTMKANGNVGIGTTAPGYKLEVAGSVRATSFISDTYNYADFVFKPGYKLASLTEVEAAIQRDGHLPGVPGEAEARANGIDLSAMQVKLLQKVEELTLHQIAQEKEIAALRRQVGELKASTETP